MIEYYEAFFELNLPRVDLDTSQLHWVPYNPRKEVQRWGASLTSLDGAISGRPDLDSILEYNEQNQSDLREKDFCVPTPQFKPFEFLNEYFHFGRSHVIRLGVGGFFPYHRDFDGETFRLVYTIRGCEWDNLVWILNGQIIKLENNRWYYINTKMIHSVFSFKGCEFAIFNVILEKKSKESLVQFLAVK